MTKKSNRKKKSFSLAAQQSISFLFHLARTSSQILANRYVALARSIGMRLRVPLPRELATQFCRHCSTFFKPGMNVRIRTRGGKVVYYCFTCKHYRRFGKQKPLGENAT